MTQLLNARFPRSNCYHPDWVIARGSGGANALWLTEWLAEALDLKPGMKVLDLGCGRAMSSVFLRREFGAEVWATDLWFSAADNLQCIRDAGVSDGVYPIHAEAHALPFAVDFFDAIVSIDSFHYYGTESSILDVTCADSLPDAWKLWLEWQKALAPDNRAEIEVLERDQGANLTYVRAVARRRPDIVLDEPIVSIPASYVRHPLLRDGS